MQTADTADTADVEPTQQDHCTQAVERGLMAQEIFERMRSMTLPMYQYSRHKAQFEFCLESDVADTPNVLILHFSTKSLNGREITTRYLRGNKLALDGENTPIAGCYVGLPEEDSDDHRYALALKLVECVNVHLATSPWRCYAVTIRRRTKVPFTAQDCQGMKEVRADHRLHISFQPWERLAVNVPDTI